MSSSMIDNFEHYKEYIKLCGGLPDTNEKGNLDKYYVIELIRRGKDNPDMPAANYHFHNYYIYSWHDFERYEAEVKEVCGLLRLRAYCSVNYKMMSQVALDTLAESARRIAAHDYKKFYNIFESCSGKYSSGDDDKWVVDIDGEVSDEYQYELREYIDSMQSGHERNVVFAMPTRSGLHLICHAFNLKQFKDDFPKSFPMKTLPDVKKNHLTLLYENL